MADALLSCPFCGGVQIEAFHHIDRGWGASWHVECVAEECGNSTCHHDTEATAIALWNTRQPTQSNALREALEAVIALLDAPAEPQKGVVSAQDYARSANARIGLGLVMIAPRLRAALQEQSK